MSRDKVDFMVILGVVLLVWLMSHIAYKRAETRVVHDCKQLHKFTVDNQVYNCYQDGEEDDN